MFKSSLADHYLEKYVRMKLGQTVFHSYTPKHIHDCHCEAGCLLEIVRKSSINYTSKTPIYCTCGKQGWHHQYHLRIDFHDAIETNKKLFDLFQEEFGEKRVVVYTWKGSCVVYVVTKENYDTCKYSYWNKCSLFEDEMEMPYEQYLDMSGKGTVEILCDLIKMLSPLSAV